MPFKSKVVVFGYSDFSESNGDSQTINKNIDIILNGMPCMFTFYKGDDEQRAVVEDLYYIADYDDQTQETKHGHVTIEFSMEEGERFLKSLDHAGMNQKIDYDFPSNILGEIAEAKQKVQKGIAMIKGAEVSSTPQLS